MKPNGISIGIRDDTAVMQVVQATAAEDAIWLAVQEAISYGMTVKQFRTECAEAWGYELQEKAKHDSSEWRKERA